jgi:putative transposase
MGEQDKHGYRHHRGAVTLIRYHFVWIPRRRRKVLVGTVAERLAALLQEIAQALNLTILRLAIQPDHIHLFVVADPAWSPAQIMHRLKGSTAHTLRQEFPHLRRMPSMWTTSYFCSTAGNVSAETIERYILAQSTRA